MHIAQVKKLHPQCLKLANYKRGPWPRLLTAAIPTLGKTAVSFCQPEEQLSWGIRTQSHRRMKYTKAAFNPQALQRLGQSQECANRRSCGKRHRIHPEEARTFVHRTPNTNPFKLEVFGRDSNLAVSLQLHTPITSLGPSFDHRTNFINGLHLKFVPQASSAVDMRSRKIVNRRQL